MKYVIHSKSERGFWHNKLGWVYAIKTATKFNWQHVEHLELPLSKNSDAEWLIIEYTD